MTETTKPKLLKSRQFHSRLFAVLAIFLLLTTRPEMSADSLLRMLMLWVGYGLIIVGAFGRVYCSCFIGGRKNKRVIRSGPFSVVRNPLYVFSFLATIGIALQSGMLSVAIGLPLLFAIYYPFVVKKEEAFLLHKFDESYAIYLREVPRWIPDFSLWNEPHETLCRPPNIRDTIRDAAAFFLLFPLFSIIALLQEQGVLPIWLTLP